MAWSLSRKKKDMPDGLWMRCDECGKTVYREDVEKSQRVCPECGFHFPLSAPERIRMLLDPWSFEELFAELAPTDPLEFKDREPYSDRLARYRDRTGLQDAIVVGTGTLDGWAVALGVLDTRFMMGSLGSVMGEKIYRLAEVAAEQKVPMILVCGSGGARMQEGVVSLMQMVKTSAAAALLQEAGVAFITLLTNPTTGGTTASFATEADVILAEPGALIGFTGPRVIEETIKQKLPAGFQRSEFMLAHGLVDAVVSRADLRETLSRLIGFLQADGAPPRAEVEAKPEDASAGGGVIGPAQNRPDGKPQATEARHDGGAAATGGTTGTADTN
jgi:acetyl-CoA carboxylase carboxyl transferase subunit beta